MASKGNSFAKLQLFLNTVVQPCDVTGLTLKSDNGGEYFSRKFQIFLKNNSIVQQFTSPYSPNQNDMAERYWRTIFDNVRALLLLSKKPESVCVRAVDTLVYTRNRVLTSAINDEKTPYESFFGKTTQCSSFKRFWLLIYIKNLNSPAQVITQRQKKQLLLVMTVQVLHTFYMIY